MSGVWSKETQKAIDMIEMHGEHIKRKLHNPSSRVPVYVHGDDRIDEKIIKTADRVMMTEEQYKNHKLTLIKNREAKGSHKYSFFLTKEEAVEVAAESESFRRIIKSRENKSLMKNRQTVRDIVEKNSLSDAKLEIMKRYKANESFRLLFNTWTQNEYSFEVIKEHIHNDYLSYPAIQHVVDKISSE